MINVWGDSIATGVVAHLSREEVAEYEKEQNLKKLNNSNTKHESNGNLLENLSNENEVINI